MILHTHFYSFKRSNVYFDTTQGFCNLFLLNPQLSSIIAEIIWLLQKKPYLQLQFQDRPFQIETPIFAWYCLGLRKGEIHNELISNPVSNCHQCFLE